MARRADLITGAAIGAGLAVLAPVVIAAAMPVVRPIARSVLKTGIRAYERGREAIDEFGEAIEDIKAEVEQELHDAMVRHSAVEVVEDEPSREEAGLG